MNPSDKANNVSYIDHSITSGSMESFRRRIVTAVIIAAIILLLVVILVYTRHVLILIFGALMLAVALRGLTDLLRNYTPLPDKAAFGIVLVTVVLLFTVGIWAAMPNLASELDELTETLPDATQRLQDYLSQYQWGRQLLDSSPNAEQLFSQGGQVISTITGIANNLLDGLGTFILMLFTAIFLALDPTVYVNGFLDLIPHNRRARIHDVLSSTYNRLKMWLLSRAVSMVTTGVLAAIGLTLLGMPFVLILSIIEGLSAFVPAIGPIVAAIPALLVAITQGPETILWVAALYLVVQGIDNYIVTPIVAQKMISVPPAMIVVPQLLLGVLMGVGGVILAAPLTVVGMVLVRKLYVEDVLDKQREGEI